MQTNECSVIKEVPFLVNLIRDNERKRIDLLGEEIATKEHLHYEGYIAVTYDPYSVEKAKTTLFFD